MPDNIFMASTRTRPRTMAGGYFIEIVWSSSRYVWREFMKVCNTVYWKLCGSQFRERKKKEKRKKREKQPDSYSNNRVYRTYNSWKQKRGSKHNAYTWPRDK